MRKNEAFPVKFLKSADARNKPIFATISHMAVELVGQGADQKKKPVLYLEDRKPMVLNATNWESLEEAFGDSDEWPGHKIKIKCERTQFQGKTTEVSGSSRSRSSRRPRTSWAARPRSISKEHMQRATGGVRAPWWPLL